MTRKKMTTIKIFARDGEPILVPGINLGDGWTLHHSDGDPKSEYWTLSFHGLWVAWGKLVKCEMIHGALKDAIKAEHFDGLDDGKPKLKPEHERKYSELASQVRAYM